MPARKTSSARTSRTTTQTSRPTRSEVSQEISYETKLIIVILLLLFVYPIGVILMWLWMREWAMWLKAILSLPIIFGIVAIFVCLFFAALFMRNIALDRNFEYQMWQYQRPYMHMYRNPAFPSTTEIPTETTTPPPANNSGAY